MIPSTCPHCGHVFQIKRDTIVIAGMNPTIDKRLNQGTYFTHECQLCHHLYYIEQPFLYRDPDKKYILLLSNQKEIATILILLQSKIPGIKYFSGIKKEASVRKEVCKTGTL